MELNVRQTSVVWDSWDLRTECPRKCPSVIHAFPASFHIEKSTIHKQGLFRGLLFFFSPALVASTFHEPGFSFAFYAQIVAWSNIRTHLQCFISQGTVWRCGINSWLCRRSQGPRESTCTITTSLPPTSKASDLCLYTWKTHDIPRSSIPEIFKVHQASQCPNGHLK